MNTSSHNLRWRKRIARKQKLHDRAVDGKPWKRGISATELARFFRMKLKPHITAQ
jgi:hypothetical protein